MRFVLISKASPEQAFLCAWRCPSQLRLIEEVHLKWAEGSFWELVNLLKTIRARPGKTTVGAQLILFIFPLVFAQRLLSAWERGQVRLRADILKKKAEKAKEEREETETKISHLDDKNLGEGLVKLRAWVRGFLLVIRKFAIRPAKVAWEKKWKEEKTCARFQKIAVKKMGRASFLIVLFFFHSRKCNQLKLSSFINGEKRNFFFVSWGKKPETVKRGATQILFRKVIIARSNENARSRSQIGICTGDSVTNIDNECNRPRGKLQTCYFLWKALGSENFALLGGWSYSARLCTPQAWRRHFKPGKSANNWSDSRNSDGNLQNLGCILQPFPRELRGEWPANWHEIQLSLFQSDPLNSSSLWVRSRTCHRIKGNWTLLWRERVSLLAFFLSKKLVHATKKMHSLAMQWVRPEAEALARVAWTSYFVQPESGLTVDRFISYVW